MAFSTTCPVNGVRLTSSKRVAAPRRASVQVLIFVAQCCNVLNSSFVFMCKPKQCIISSFSTYDINMNAQLVTSVFLSCNLICSLCCSRIAFAAGCMLSSAQTTGCSLH